MSATRCLTLTGLAAAAIGLLAACGSSGPGQLAVNLMDAPNPAVDQIVVNVTKVTAHSTTAGWVTIGPMTSPLTVDLLKLQTYATSLGLVSLPAGTVTQIRLLISRDGNYVVPSGSTTQAPLVVPSGYESGIKILGPWDVPACTRLTVTLDFDGKNSIEYHLADGTWILRPVIRPVKADGTAISCTAPPGGQACGPEVPCPEGQVCSSGTCTSAAPVATGGACTTGPQCLTGVCTSGTCSPGSAGAPCRTGSDCASGSCQNDTCGPGSAAGAGAACTSNAGCLSGNCSGGTCQPGGQGSPCNVTSDCQSTPTVLVCQNGTCQPPML